MNKKEYHKYLQSEQWVDFRNNLKNKIPYCEVCGFTAKLHCHHLSYEHVGQETPDHKKMEKWFLVVCEGCHNLIHTDNDYQIANPFKNRRPVPKKRTLKKLKKMIIRKNKYKPYA